MLKSAIADMMATLTVQVYISAKLVRKEIVIIGSDIQANTRGFHNFYLSVIAEDLWKYLLLSVTLPDNDQVYAEVLMFCFLNEIEVISRYWILDLINLDIHSLNPIVSSNGGSK